MRKYFGRGIAFVLAGELRIATVVLGMTVAVLVAVSWPRYRSATFREGILVEAHGMVLDILVIGILILWLNLLRDARERARRFQEEIDDLREWKSEEASYRIAGSIRRLNAVGVQKVILSRCFLRKADLRDAKLAGAPMHRVDLGEARLRGADFTGANLDTAFLGHCDLRNACFDNAVLKRARLINVTANNASFRGADLVKADMRHGQYRSVDFQNARFGQTIFIGADLAGADLRNCQGLEAPALLLAGNLGYAKLDPAIESAIRAVKPQLLESYRQPG